MSSEKGVAQLVSENAEKRVVVSQSLPPARSSRSRVNDQLNFLRFVDELNRRVRELRSKPKDEIYELAIRLIEDIFRSEGIVETPERGQNQFCRLLWIEPIWRDELRRIIRALLTYSRSRSRELFVSAAELIAAMEAFVSWYARRKMTLMLLGDGRGGIETEALFNLTLHHDVTVNSAVGMLVTCSTRLVGRKSQLLWLKGRILLDAQEINVRPGWELWVDGEESLILSSATGERSKKFVSSVPLKPPANRWISDEIELFIPYAALDIPPGRSAIKISLSLCDQRGKELFAGELEAEVSRQLNGEGEGAPAPQALALWSVDYQSGSRVERLDIRDRRRLLENGTEALVAYSDFDVIGSRGRPIVLECRLRTKEGALVPSAELTDPLGLFILRRRLVPQSTVARYRDYEIEIPISAFGKVLDDESIFVELSVVGVDGRALCGALCRTPPIPKQAKVTAPQISTELAVQIELNDPLFGVQVLGFEVQPSYRFGAAECTRVEVLLHAESWSESACYVSVALEDGTGTELGGGGLGDRRIERVLILGGMELPKQYSIVVNIPHRDFQDTVDTQNDKQSPRKQLRARVRVYSLAESCVYDGYRAFYWKRQPSGAEEAHPADRPYGDIVIADISRTASVDPARLQCRLSLNLRCGPRASGQFVLYYEVCDTEERYEESLLETKGSYIVPGLPGRAMKIDLADVVSNRLFASGWYQVHHPLDCGGSEDLELFFKGARDVKAMVFSDTGRLLQVVTHRINAEENLFVHHLEEKKQDEKKGTGVVGL